MYACFLGEKRAAILRDDLLGDKGGRVHISTGITASTVEQPNFFRICPACSCEQQDQRNTTWWVLNHQLAGVNVCTPHGAKLIDTEVLIRHRRTRHEFVPAPAYQEQAILEAEPEQVIVAEIADEILRLRPVFDPVELNQLFRRRLSEEGYLTKGGSIRWKLADDLAEFYGDDYLSSIQSTTSRQNPAWLAALLRRPGHVHAPVHYLLVMGFLRLRVADYSAPPPAEPQQEGVAKPVGRWQQHDAEIARLWMDNCVNLRAIAKAVQADPMTVKRRAVAMGLPFPRPTKRPTRMMPPARKSRDPEGDLARRRAAWLALRTAHPGFTRKELRKADPAAFAWIYRCDQAWLFANQPPATKLRGRPGRVANWQERDIQLSAEVKTIAADLREIGIEGQITTREIARRLFYEATIEKNSAKLPMTAAALASESESRVEYAVRRIKRTGGHLRLRPALRQHEQVVEALKDAGA
jgi:hypothetical protein